MNRLVLLLALLSAISVHAQTDTSVAEYLRCEYLENPQGIDRPAPRLSWRMRPVSGQKGQLTSAYRILVSSQASLLDRDQGDLWDTGRVTGAQPVCVPYTGQPLKTFQDCHWKVKLWDEQGHALPWSETATWSMGIVTPSDWQAQWIGHAPDSLREDVFAGQWFDQARWIWHAQDNPNAPIAGTRQFKRALNIQNDTVIEWAEMIFTANDAFALAVNGQSLTQVPVEFDAAGDIPRFNLKPFLTAGRSEILITAEKVAPRFRDDKIKEVAGCIGVIKIKYSGKPVETIVTDKAWFARKDSQDDWASARDLASASTHWRRIPGWRQPVPSPVFRKAFSLDKTIRSAKVAISGLGYYELYCNGSRVGDHQLDPAFTNYDKSVLYVCYDITSDLKRGHNALGVMLGNGWYNMHTRATWNCDRAPWRDVPKLKLQLGVTYADGSRETLVSDDSWRAGTGPVVLDSIRNGEVYDARLDRPGWATAKFDDSDWATAQQAKPPRGELISQTMPAIEVMETVTPTAISEPNPGVFVVDMGKNMSGWARIKVKGSAGKRVQLRYSERLDPDGMINQRRNRRYMYQGPFQTDTYVLKGQGEEVWEPRFTYHGFRYVEVTGWPGPLTPHQIEGRFIHTAFKTPGSFDCSDDLLNTIATLTDRAYRSNYVGYPTDCPQREKNGWTGDAHLATEQAMFTYENVNAYDKWLRDLLDARTADGDLPGIVPTGGWGYSRDNGPGWGSAAVLIPWYLYEYTGDSQILADHYTLMRGYVDFLDKSFPDHIVEMGRGDWVYLHTRTPSPVTSTALFCENTRIVARSAKLLGYTDEARRYSALVEEIKQAYHQRFFKGDGVYTPGGQTSQSLSLFYDLVPATERAACVEQLVKAVHAADDHIDCGILGAKALFHVLSDNGHHDLAYEIATQPDFPGYGDWIARGATALWEDWPDKEGSLNHIMFGDIVTWFNRSLAGIQVDPKAPGFRHIVFRPRPVADLTFARAKTHSPFGVIESHWQIENGTFNYAVTVPPNAHATVLLPDGSEHRISSGQYRFAVSL